MANPTEGGGTGLKGFNTMIDQLMNSSKSKQVFFFKMIDQHINHQNVDVSLESVRDSTVNNWLSGFTILWKTMTTFDLKIWKVFLVRTSGATGPQKKMPKCFLFWGEVFHSKERHVAKFFRFCDLA